jgi:hypothetical protein
MNERGKDKGHSLTEWVTHCLTLTPPYIPENSSDYYLAAEHRAVTDLPRNVFLQDSNRD